MKFRHHRVKRFCCVKTQPSHKGYRSVPGILSRQLKDHHPNLTHQSTNTPTSIRSPTSLSHCTMVPSSIVEDKAGMYISIVLP